MERHPQPEPVSTEPDAPKASVSHTEAFLGQASNPAPAPAPCSPPPASPTQNLSDADRQYLLDGLLAGIGRQPAAPEKPAVLIANVLGDYERRLRYHDGDSEDHVACVLRRLQKVIETAKWVTIEDITEQSCELAIAEIIATTPGRRGRKTISVRTANHYLQAAKQFCRWLNRRAKLLNADPLIGLDKRTIKASDLTFVRRAFTQAEFDALFVAAFYGPSVESIPGPDQAMLFLTATNSGFRKSELGSMTKDHFLLELNRVLCEAAYSKNGDKADLPVAQQTVQILSEWLRHKPNDDSLIWPISSLREEVADKGGKNRKTALMVHKACERAGIPITTVEGTVDFHSLRKTYITNLSQITNSIKVVQRLARHSDSRLTLNIYTQVRREEEVEAVNKLPAPPMSAPRFN